MVRFITNIHKLTQFWQDILVLYRPTNCWNYIPRLAKSLFFDMIDKYCAKFWLALVPNSAHIGHPAVPGGFIDWGKIISSASTSSLHTSLTVESKRVRKAYLQLNYFTQLLRRQIETQVESSGLHRTPYIMSPIFWQLLDQFLHTLP